MQARLSAFVVVGCHCERSAAIAGSWALQWYTLQGIYVILDTNQAAIASPSLCLL